MAESTPSDVRETLDSLRPVLEATAKNLVRHLADNPVAQAQGTFEQFEELHTAVTDALALEVMKLILQRQAEALDQADQLEARLCPTCQRLTRLQPPKSRRLDTTAGTLQWDQSARYCPHCRRAFFPSKPTTQT